MIIFTHRGLEPSKQNTYFESSYEQFEDHITRGYGIEFEINFLKDEIIVFHDPNLSRATNDKDNRNFSEISLNDINKLNKEKGKIPTVREELKLIEKGDAPLHAMHLKGSYQSKEKIDLLLDEIKKIPEIIPKILIFDLKPEYAKYIKSKIPELKLAPSIAHEYDIKRYNNIVKETLISIEEAIDYKKQMIYDWCWLDEWDTLNEGKGEKLFYTKDNFNKLKQEGYKIALVTPELHSSSPGLLGGESHKHARNKEILFQRITKILELKPDAICTDYPEEVKRISFNF